VPTDATPTSFQQAVALHQAGRLAPAEAAYRAVLASDPAHADALNMLGAVLFQTNRPADALDYIRRAVALDPRHPVYLGNLGLILSHTGRAAEAAEAYRKATAADPENLDLRNNLGNALLSAGLSREAAEVYGRIAQRLPDSPEIFSNLGVALMRSGKSDEADAAYRRSLRLRPDHAETQFNFGLCCGMRAKWDDAVAAFRRAVALRPDYADAYNNLGNALSEQLKYAEAEPVYRRAIELRPDYVQAHNNLGIALTKLGRTPEAIPQFRKALELRPHNRNVLYHLANALKEDGRPGEAVAAAQDALRLNPDDAESHVTMSLIYVDQRRWADAMDSANRALAAKPSWAGAHNNLGFLLLAQRRHQEAVAAFEKAMELDPNFREAYVNLTTAFNEMGRLDDALATYELAMARSIQTVEGLMNYSGTLKDAGRISECVAVARRAAALTSDPLKIQNYMLAVHYDPDLTAAEICDINRRWGRQVSARAAPHRKPHPNVPDPDRRLRIGYVSADLRHHVVGYNVLPLFEFHDHANFEVFAYSNASPEEEDAVTAHFRETADQFRPIKALSDAQAADLIRRDQIDILIDLGLHTAKNRLPLFAHKPAPVQFTFAGYPGTTGLPEIDYRLTDPYLDPPGSDPSYTEKSVRLPDSFWCYRPLNRDPSVSPLPALKNGHITFGALTNFCKINPRVLALWARVMSALPTSRILLIAKPGSHRARTHATFQSLGIAPDRVEFLNYLPRAQYLETYNRIDIGLDTFPYNGHTTSLDSFWMGVPVITLVGQTAVSRAGLCQLSNLALPDLAATTEEDFLKIATTLASDLPRLAALRAGLRTRMEQSPLMNYERFTRNVEAAYRQAWRKWCADYSP
jgi:predicted O-linked N-acetylglucosamine transferase (SPINDLY family)